MFNRIVAGAVVYAKDLARVSAFYKDVGGFAIAEQDDTFVALESPGYQLVVVAIPAHIAADIHIESPPVRREETPIKLMIVVSSIHAARPVVARLGGELDAPEREWEFRGYRVCDGLDPEGNVIQLREVVE